MAPPRSGIVGRTRLLDPFEIERNPPANLQPEDDHLFRHEYRRSFPPTELFRLRDVLVTSEGVVISGRRVLADLEYFPGETARLGLRDLLRTRFRARSVFGDDERYFTAFNRWSGNNYFHWMCDVLPRVYLARDVVESSTVVLPQSHHVPFVERSLAPFRPSRIAYFPDGQTAAFGEVTVPGHIAITGNYHPETLRGLAAFLGRPSPRGRPEAGGRLVYATRRKARYRYVVNEDEVASFLESNGFEIVENERLSLDEQIALYAETSVLVGVMGANLTNILFMQPGSAVLQLTRGGDASNHLYYALASAVGVRFYYQLSPYVDAGWGIRWNVTVDLEELGANVERILADSR